MSAAIAEPEVPATRCKIDEVFTGPFIELITLAPRNPVVRGLILSQTQKMPGPECETFKQIKDWVETTCDPRAGGGHQAKASGHSHAAEGITVTVEFSETEYGTANYSVHRSGEAELELDADELLEMIQKSVDAGDGIDGVVTRIAEEIEDNAWNRCDPDLDDYGEYDYDNYDSTDSDNSREQFSRTQIRERLLVFLRERHPELLEELA